MKNNNEPLFLDGEIWKPIINADGYEISSFGRIKSINHRRMGYPHIISQREARDGGYMKIDLDKYNWRPSIHRLVALHFIDNPSNFRDVLHKDDNKQNNNVENLEWGTHSRNMIDAFDSKKFKHTFHKTIRPVIQLDYNTGDEIKRYDRVASAARELNISLSNIVQAAKGNKKSCGGFKWKYA